MRSSELVVLALVALALLAACGGRQPAARATASPATARPDPPPPSGDARATEGGPAGTGGVAATEGGVAPTEGGVAATEGGEAAMNEILRLYDRADFEAALAKAEAILATDPDDVRVLRVAVSSACILGDGERARRYFERLPAVDQEQMSRRCRRYGVELGPPKAP